MNGHGSRALLLGAGMVAPPLVRYLLDRGVMLTVAANNPRRAAALVGDAATARVVEWQVEDDVRLSALIEQNDLVISLLPATMHVGIAERCVAAKRHFVSTSYVSSEMRALDRAAKAAGVILLNELGVDPGIDHMSAMAVIDAIRHAGGVLRGFRSYCGGLPAPEANDNPWGYKFSWNPLGVLRASRSSARYRMDGALVELGPGQAFSCGDRLRVGDFDFEAYANRDSLAYLELYGLEGIETMYRGTLRWPGWSETIVALSALGLLDDQPVSPGESWGATLRRSAQLPPGSSVAAAVAARLGIGEDAEVIHRLAWLGLFDETPADGPSVIEALATQMAARMALASGQRDILVMHHIFDYTVEDGRQEQRTSTMISYGDPDGDTAMAKTVGLPAAIGAKLVIEGTFSEPGVQIPVIPALYGPILAELAELGITLEEKKTS